MLYTPDLLHMDRNTFSLNFGAWLSFLEEQCGELRGASPEGKPRFFGKKRARS